MKKTFSFILTLLFLSAGATAMAQDQPIKITSSALIEQAVVNAKGEKELVRQPAVKVLPGEKVIFVNTYVNEGTAPAENVVINNAIPEHMTYVNESAQGKNTVATFSVNGGQSFGPLPELTVTEADGTERPAAPFDVTHIRWTRTSPLAAGEEARVEFNALLK